MSVCSNTRPCGTFSWTPEATFSSCSVSCDGGVQSRPVHCVGPDGNRWPDAVCNNATLQLGAKPTEAVQVCNTQPCMTTMWDLTSWSNCSSRCGPAGQQVRSVTCRRADGTAVADSVCARMSPKPVDSQKCGGEKCPEYKWVAGEYGDCSVGCSGGVQTREVRCENNFGARVSSRHCFRTQKERPRASKHCNKKPCLGASSWVIDPWQPCSTSCGGGTKIRSVKCRVSYNSTDTHCQSILPLPITADTCNTHACITYKWETSDWSQCSKSCDDAATLALTKQSSTGVQTRSLRCRASDGSLVSTRRCELQMVAGETAPETSRPCQSNPKCKTFKWRVGEWGQCSKRCGFSGSQHRAVHCADDNNANVKAALCLFSGPKPESARECNRNKCVRSYRWEAAEWGECSVSCGPNGGVQQRAVRCVDKFGSTVTGQACELTVGAAPDTSRPCNKNKPCRSYRWAIKPWSSCSSWCGGGRMERSISCAGSDGRVHKDIYCAMTSGEKAETVRACNTAPCVQGQWKSAAEWSECSRVCGGGSKERKVACVAGDSSVLPDKACESSGVRPQSQAPCNMHKCLTTSWFVGSWSKCSSKCDGGIQQREVACIASSGVVKPDINCAYAGTKAAKERACNTTPCSAYVRKYSDWSECTSSCGGGSQERTQMCFNTVANRAARSPDKCSAPVEELKRRCNTQKCVVYQWNLGQCAFQTCSSLAVAAPSRC